MGEEEAASFTTFLQKLPKSTLKSIHERMAQSECEWELLGGKLVEEVLTASNEPASTKIAVSFECFMKLPQNRRGLLLSSVTMVTKEHAEAVLEEAFLEKSSAAFFISDAFEIAAKLSGCLRSKKWLKQIFEWMVSCGNEEVCSLFLSSYVSIFEKTLPVFTRRKCEGVLGSLATEPTSDELRIATHLVLTFQDILPPSSITQTLLTLVSTSRGLVGENEGVKHDTANLLYTLLSSGKVDNSSLTDSLYSLFQAAYTATTSPADQCLLNILKLLQQKGVTSKYPFAYGPEHVPEMRGIKNITLYNEYSCKVLEGLDTGLLTGLINNFPLTTDAPPPTTPTYSAEFILSLLYHVCTHGEMECRTILASPISRVAFLSLSSYDPVTRTVGYRCLEVILQLCEGEKFKERAMCLHLLKMLENSVTEKGQRIPHLIAYFIGVVLQTLFTPHKSLFTTVCHFLLQRAVFDFGDVPMFYKMFCSSEGATYRHEQNWLLDMLCCAVRDENDYQILARRHVLQLCFTQLYCPGTDPGTVRLIKRLFEKVLGIRKSKIQKELAEQGICREILT
eukprot:sb/3463500/